MLQYHLHIIIIIIALEYNDHHATSNGLATSYYRTSSNASVSLQRVIGGYRGVLVVIEGYRWLLVVIDGYWWL